MDNVVCVFIDATTVGRMEKIASEKLQQKKNPCPTNDIMASMCTSDPNSDRTRKIDLAVEETQNRRFRLYPYDGFRKREQKRTKAHLEKAFEKLDWKSILTHFMDLRDSSVYPE